MHNAWYYLHCTYLPKELWLLGECFSVFCAYMSVFWIPNLFFLYNFLLGKKHPKPILTVSVLRGMEEQIEPKAQQNFYNSKQWWTAILSLTSVYNKVINVLHFFWYCGFLDTVQSRANTSFSLFSTLKLLFHCVNHFRDNVVTPQNSYSLLEYLLFIQGLCAASHKACWNLVSI